MKVCLVLFLCLLGSALSAEEGLALPEHGTTTVCVQLRGAGPVCGPVIEPPHSESRDDYIEAGHPGSSRAADQRMMDDMMRSAQLFTVPMPPRNAVFQEYIQGVPVYKLQAPRAAEEPYNFHPQGLHAPLPMMRAPQQPLQTIPQNVPAVPCPPQIPRQAPRFVTIPPPEQYYNAPPSSGALYRAPEQRTFPMAPYGLEPQFRQPLPLARQDMKAASEGCFDKTQQMRTMVPKAEQPMLSQPAMREADNAMTLAKQCDEQEKELLRKTDEIANLRKEIQRLTDESEKAVPELDKKEATGKSAQSDTLKEMTPEKSEGQKSKNNTSTKKK